MICFYLLEVILDAINDGRFKQMRRLINRFFALSILFPNFCGSGSGSLNGEYYSAVVISAGHF